MPEPAPCCGVTVAVGAVCPAFSVSGGLDTAGTAARANTGPGLWLAVRTAVDSGFALDVVAVFRAAVAGVAAVGALDPGADVRTGVGVG